MIPAGILTKTVTLKRLAADGGNAYTDTYATVGTILIELQPVTAEAAVIVDGLVGQTFMAFAELSPAVLLGDVLVDGTSEYSVQGVETFNTIGLRHQEITLRKMK